MDKKPVVGGQAVMEGVMMRNGNRMAVTVRQTNGSLTIKKYEAKTEEKPWYKKWAFIRGIVNFVAMMKVGVQCLNDSVKMLGLEEEEPSKFEKWIVKKTGKNAMDVLSGFSMVIGIGFAVLLFFILPNLVTSWIAKSVTNSFTVNLIEGGIRLTIFILYLSAISMMKDIKRFFGFHGAEHKTINCFEAGKKLTVENVQSYSTAHPRCGTSFLVLVLVLSIVIFSLTGWAGQEWYLRLALRLALLPLVAAISYEMLMGLAKFDNFLVKIIRWPGMQVQKMTTREPDDDMVAAAIASALAVMPEQFAEEAMPEGYQYPPAFSEETEVAEAVAEELATDGEEPTEDEPVVHDAAADA